MGICFFAAIGRDSKAGSENSPVGCFPGVGESPAPGTPVCGSGCRELSVPDQRIGGARTDLKCSSPGDFCDLSGRPHGFLFLPHYNMEFHRASGFFRKLFFFYEIP